MNKIILRDVVPSWRVDYYLKFYKSQIDIPGVLVDWNWDRWEYAQIVVLFPSECDELITLMLLGLNHPSA